MIFCPLNLASGTVLLRLIVSLMRHVEVKTSAQLNSLKICFSSTLGEVK